MDAANRRKLIAESLRILRTQDVASHHRVFQGGLLEELVAELKSDCPAVDPSESVVPVYEAMNLRRFFFSIDPHWVEEAILEFTHKGDYVVNPFGGSGTVPIIASLLQRSCVSYEVNPEYRKIAEGNINKAWAEMDRRSLDRGYITLRDRNAADMLPLGMFGPRLVLFGPPEVSSSSMAAEFWRSIQNILKGTTLAHVVMFYGIRNMDTSTFDNWMEGAKPLFWPIDMRMRRLTDSNGTPLHEFRVVFRPDHLPGHAEVAKDLRWPVEE